MTMAYAVEAVAGSVFWLYSVVLIH